MRTAWAVGAIVLATAACGSSAAAPARSTPAHQAAAECGPHGAKTLAIDHQARVYNSGGGVYGCAGAGGRGYLLGRTTARPGQPRVGKLALAGQDVAYAISHMGVDTLSTGVIVRRLDNGLTLHVLSATTEPLGPEFSQAVEAIVVKPDGAVAWIGEGGSIIRRTHHVELLRFDRRGEKRLDSGTGIDPQSLQLRGSRLTWREHGAPRSATLR